MSRLDHGRPLFKVMEAGGPERIRTISEDARAAQAGSRPADARCGLCGSRKVRTQVRCAVCRTQIQAVREARKSSGPLRARRGAPAAARRRSGVCPGCHTELPVTRVCGFCA